MYLTMHTTVLAERRTKRSTIAHPALLERSDLSFSILSRLLETRTALALGLCCSLTACEDREVRRWSELLCWERFSFLSSLL